ncbi:MAG TPA: GumC family protein [Alphaproteobacteria bacterium]|nr:GumC family protein [Alphaproteobacteria bacterium]
MTMQNPPNDVFAADLRGWWAFTRRQGRFIGSAALAGAVLGLFLALVLPKHYAAEAMLVLDARKMRVTNIDAVVSDLSPDSAAIRTEMSIIKSRAVIDRVIDELELAKDPHFAGGAEVGAFFIADEATRTAQQRAGLEDYLLRHVKTVNDGRSYNILVRYKDSDAARAAKIANGFAKAYIADQLEVKYDLAQRAVEWLNKRMDVLREEVSRAERAAEEFKNQNNLVGIGEETVVQKQLEAVTPQLLQARADLAAAQARYGEIKGLKGEKLASSSVVLASPFIQQLKQQEAEVRRKEADLSTRYGNKHPSMINVRGELRSIRSKIHEEIRKIIAACKNDYAVGKSKVKALEAELARLEKQAGQGNQAMVALRQLEREAASSRSLYEGFLNRSKQIAEQQDFQLPEARLVAEATPPLKPYFPNLPVFLVAGLVIGGMAGFAAAYMREALAQGKSDFLD